MVLLQLRRNQSPALAFASAYFRIRSRSDQPLLLIVPTRPVVVEAGFASCSLLEDRDLVPGNLEMR